MDIWFSHYYPEFQSMLYALIIHSSLKLIIQKRPGEKELSLGDVYTSLFFYATTRL